MADWGAPLAPSRVMIWCEQLKTSPQLYNICAKLKTKAILNAENGLFFEEGEGDTPSRLWLDRHVTCASKRAFESTKNQCALRKKRKPVFSGRKWADQTGRCARQSTSLQCRARVCPSHRWSSHNSGRMGRERRAQGRCPCLCPGCWRPLRTLRPLERWHWNSFQGRCTQLPSTQGWRWMADIPKQPVLLLVLEESRIKVCSKLVTWGGFLHFFPQPCLPWSV